MKTDKTDIEIVRQKLLDIVDLWCVLNTAKGDKNTLDVMTEISSFIEQKVLLKRWNELHPIGSNEEEFKIQFSDDPDHMEKRRKIISRLLA